MISFQERFQVHEIQEEDQELGSAKKKPCGIDAYRL